MSKENKGIITILYQLIITIKERDAKTASLFLCADKDKKKARHFLPDFPFFIFRYAVYLNQLAEM